MHSSPLWQARVKPSKKPKHIPSPVQARQGAFLLGPVQERLEFETLCETYNAVIRLYGGIMINSFLEEINNRDLENDDSLSLIEMKEENNILSLTFKL
jgi:hypothetical protein